MEGEIAVVVYAEVVRGCGRPGAPAAAGVVTILAQVVRGVAAASRLDYMVAVGLSFGPTPAVWLVQAPASARHRDVEKAPFLGDLVFAAAYAWFQHRGR